MQTGENIDNLLRVLILKRTQLVSKVLVRTSRSCYVGFTPQGTAMLLALITSFLSKKRERKKENCQRSLFLRPPVFLSVNVCFKNLFWGISPKHSAVSPARSQCTTLINQFNVNVGLLQCRRQKFYG